MLADNELDASGQGILPLGRTDDLNTLIFKVANDRMRFSITTEAVKFVNEDTADPSRLSISSESSQFIASMDRAARLRAVNIMLTWPTCGAETLFDLNLDRRRIILRMGRISCINRIIFGHLK